MKRSSLLAVALFLSIAARAAAGDFFEPDAVAIHGYDPVAYFTQKKPVPGLPSLTATYEGSVFRFATPEDRDLFQKDPAHYAPQYRGFCAYGAAKGHKAPTDPAAFTVVNDKLYLNYNDSVAEKWRSDIPGNIKAADDNWPTVSKQSFHE